MASCASDGAAPRPLEELLLLMALAPRERREAPRRALHMELDAELMISDCCAADDENILMILVRSSIR